MFGKLLIGGVGLILILSTSVIGTPYWHGVGGPEELKIDSFKIAILYSDPVINVKHATAGRIVGILDEPRAVNGFTICSLAVAIDDLFIDSLEALPDVELVEPYYLTVKDYPLLVGSDFIAEFKDNVSQATIDSINQHYGVAIHRRLQS